MSADKTLDERLFPITAAVYGKRKKERKVEERPPRGHETQLWRKISQREMDGLARRFPGRTRRLAARKRLDAQEFPA